jgi:hypothetical protein
MPAESDKITVPCWLGSYQLRREVDIFSRDSESRTSIKDSSSKEQRPTNVRQDILQMFAVWECHRMPQIW